MESNQFDLDAGEAQRVEAKITVYSEWRPMVLKTLAKEAQKLDNSALLHGGALRMEAPT